MNGRRSVYAATPLLAILLCASVSDAATITVPAGGDLQAAITAARPGDTILLAPGATYVGNFKLPVHGGTEYVTIRSGASDALLPGVGQRISPAYAASLPKIVSPNNVAALRTAPGAAYWKLMFLELGPNANASGTALDLGDGSSAVSSFTADRSMGSDAASASTAPTRPSSIRTSPTSKVSGRIPRRLAAGTAQGRTGSKTTISRPPVRS
jgi:hypothetical protein